MGARLLRGLLFTRRFEGTRMSERKATVATLEDLYQQCLDTTAPELLERVVLAGRDPRGRRREFTFEFASSIAPPPRRRAPRAPRRSA